MIILSLPDGEGGCGCADACTDPVAHSTLKAVLSGIIACTCSPSIGTGYTVKVDVAPLNNPAGLTLTWDGTQWYALIATTITVYYESSCTTVAGGPYAYSIRVALTCSCSHWTLSAYQAVGIDGVLQFFSGESTGSLPQTLTNTSTCTWGIGSEPIGGFGGGYGGAAIISIP